MCFGKGGRYELVQRYQIGKILCGNQLIDAAMALSGHPRFDMPDRGWTDEEIDFLMFFVKEG